MVRLPKLTQPELEAEPGAEDVDTGSDEPPVYLPDPERSVEEFQDRADAMIDQARKRLPI